MAVAPDRYREVVVDVGGSSTREEIVRTETGKEAGNETGRETRRETGRETGRETWTVEHVAAVAPTPKAVAAAEPLATPGGWM